jgi:hypothetical protein
MSVPFTDENALLPDIKAEIIVAEILDAIPGDREVLFVPVGAFSRSHKQDIESIEVADGAKKGSKQYTVRVNRNGLYDALPEGVFHQKKNLKPHKSTEEVKDEIKQHKREEVSARKFFAPFEHELYNIRLLMEQKERASISLKDFESTMSSSFRKFWGIPHEIDSRYFGALFHLLPTVRKVKGLPGPAASFMQSVLGVPAEIEVATSNMKVSRNEFKNLGTTRLGIDSMLTAKEIQSYGWHIKLGPVPVKKMHDFLPGRKAIKLIDYCIQLLAPVEIPCTYEIDIEHSNDLFILSDEGHSCYLGYSSQLPKVH